MLVQGPGSADVDMVSMFPEDTWKGRENGLRKDLVQLLADLRPGFIRFPGGCIVEGRFLDTRYQWKTTVGEPADRRLIVNRWNDEFANRAAPGGRAFVLTDDADGENSLDAPAAIAPAERTIEAGAAPFEASLPAHSLTVLKIPVR